MTEFRWTARSERAALLLAEDVRADHEIATEIGITRTALSKWKKKPEFMARVSDIVGRRKSAALRYSLAQQDRRIGQMDDRYQKLRQIMDERADAPELNDVPGGQTGLITRQIKLSATGAQVEEFVIDGVLLKEMRALEEHVAKELGQWVDKRELTGADGGPIVVANARDELAARLAALAERHRALSSAGESE